MAGDLIGRKVTISMAGVVVATARTTSLTINNSSINVTDGSDNGIQKLLDDMGEKSVDVSVDGMYLSTDQTLLELSLTPTPKGEIVLTFGTEFTITGDFFMNSFSNGAPYNDGVTFSAAFSSQGAVVKAAIV
ncbi:MAG: hypothetical protein KAT00_00085 [Planctomycetes bacterium]|nr:hypothetical protein [Planctomycetota bacterium]